MEPGTWTGLVTGIGSIAVALTLGVLAWREARNANRWAEKSVVWEQRAVLATETANRFAEAAMQVDFHVEWSQFGGRLDEEGNRSEVVAFVKIQNRGARVWVHSARGTMSNFRGLDYPDEWGVYEDFEVVLRRTPVMLHGGEQISGRPTLREPLNMNYANTTSAQLEIVYSVETGGPTHSILRVINLPDTEPGAVPGMYVDESGEIWESGSPIDDDWMEESAGDRSVPGPDH